MKKILYISFYFDPDLCAGSFRNTPLANQLSDYENVHVDVATTMPNRYSCYRVKAQNKEYKKNLSINRFSIPRHKSSIFDQVLSFCVFYYKVKKYSEKNKYDLVFASTSRFFSGYLAYMALYPV